MMNPRTSRWLAALALALGVLPAAHAGEDLVGQVAAVQIASDGKLWFSMIAAPGTTAPSTYCKPGWAGLNLYVPKDDPEYPYYYAMLMTAVSKGKRVYVANANATPNDGTGPCDITKTGYGLMIWP